MSSLSNLLLLPQLIVINPPQIYLVVLAADAGHIVVALHIDAWLGDIRVGRVYRLLEHALVDSGFPGADVAGAALQARLEGRP